MAAAPADSPSRQRHSGVRRRAILTLPAALAMAGAASRRPQAVVAASPSSPGGTGRSAAQVLDVTVPADVQQGRTLLVAVEVADENVDGSLGAPPVASGSLAADSPGPERSVALRFFDASGGSRGRRLLGLAGIPVDAPLGDWTLIVEPGSTPDADAAPWLGRVQVVDGGFAQQRVRFPADLLPLLEPSVAAEELLTLATVMATQAAPEPHWRGSFRMPVTGPMVTGHGARRDYLDPAGRLVAQGQHAGIDLAVPAGTPIAAPAAGVVAFAGRWAIRGNAVVLDHGGGVHTVHAHAAELFVASGQEVAAGQPVGRVGTTGLSTGPHLHWEVRVGGVAVDPLEWTQRADLALP